MVGARVKSGGLGRGLPGRLVGLGLGLDTEGRGKSGGPEGGWAWLGVGGSVGEPGGLTPF